MSLSKHQKTGPIYYIWLTLVDRNFLFFLNREKRCSIRKRHSPDFCKRSRFWSFPFPAKAARQNSPTWWPITCKSRAATFTWAQQAGESPRRDSWTPENKLLCPWDGPLKRHPHLHLPGTMLCPWNTPAWGIVPSDPLQGWLPDLPEATGSLSVCMCVVCVCMCGVHTHCGLLGMAFALRRHQNTSQRRGRKN